MDLNDQTIQSYRANFDKYVANTPQVPSDQFKKWMDNFLSLLPKSASILEIGSAMGRDARYFASQGFKVTCADVIPEALQKLSAEGFEVEEYDFRTAPKTHWKHKFDGFFANAVLLHAQQEDFVQALKNILYIVKPGGYAAFSLKAGEGEEIATQKLDAPRYFNKHTKEELEKLLPTIPLQIISLEYADENKWLHVIARTD